MGNFWSYAKTHRDDLFQFGHGKSKRKIPKTEKRSRKALKEQRLRDRRMITLCLEKTEESRLSEGDALTLKAFFERLKTRILTVKERRLLFAVFKKNRLIQAEPAPSPRSSAADRDLLRKMMGKELMAVTDKKKLKFVRRDVERCLVASKMGSRDQEILLNMARELKNQTTPLTAEQLRLHKHYYYQFKVGDMIHQEKKSRHAAKKAFPRKNTSVILRKKASDLKGDSK